MCYPALLLYTILAQITAWIIRCNICSSNNFYIKDSLDFQTILTFLELIFKKEVLGFFNKLWTVSRSTEVTVSLWKQVLCFEFGVVTALNKTWIILE